MAGLRGRGESWKGTDIRGATVREGLSLGCKLSKKSVRGRCLGIGQMCEGQGPMDVCSWDGKLRVSEGEGRCLGADVPRKENVPQTLYAGPNDDDESTRDRFQSVSGKDYGQVDPGPWSPGRSWSCGAPAPLSGVENERPTRRTISNGSRRHLHDGDRHFIGSISSS